MHYLQFQSTPLHEGRRDILTVFAAVVLFQSTPLHEGRHHIEPGVGYLDYGFNPRPYTRGDFENLS